MSMTATEELRRLLDELRKLACDINEEEIRSHSVITLNQGRYNRQFRLDMNHDWLNVWHAELERILQAIAATLGAGTCQLKPWKMERDTGFYDCMECDCGYVSDVADWAEWHYCPRCGKRIVEVDA